MEAHELVKLCMVLWTGDPSDPIGPTMGESLSNSRRVHLALGDIQEFKIRALQNKVAAISEGSYLEFENHMKNCAN